MERDLTKAVKENKLSPAFHVEELCINIEDLLQASRCPILTGESGVGKTAVINEIVQRIVQGKSDLALKGKRILQFSIQKRKP